MDRPKRWCGDRLTEARAASGMSQREVATYIGITSAAICHHETNRHTPSINIVCRYANFFRRPVEFFLRN